MIPAKTRRWPVVQLAIFAAMAVVAPLAWHFVQEFPFTGTLSWSDIRAIRKTIADDSRTKGEPILEISDGDGYAEAVIGVQRSPQDGKGLIVCLQKRKGTWVIVTSSRWSMEHDPNQPPSYPPKWIHRLQATAAAHERFPIC